MKRFRPEQIRWIEIGLLIGVTLIGLYGVLAFLPSGFGPPKGVSQASSIAVEADTSPPEATLSIAPAVMEEYIALLQESASGQDPFLSSGEQEWKGFLAELRDRPPRLKGIIRVEGESVALIQDSRFREGDEVKGFRILKIEEKQVLLTKGGKTYAIRLAE